VAANDHRSEPADLTDDLSAHAYVEYALHVPPVDDGWLGRFINTELPPAPLRDRRLCVDQRARFGQLLLQGQLHNGYVPPCPCGAHQSLPVRSLGEIADPALDLGLGRVDGAGAIRGQPVTGSRRSPIWPCLLALDKRRPQPLVHQPLHVNPEGVRHMLMILIVLIVVAVIGRGLWNVLSSLIPALAIIAVLAILGLALS
jgi:hypothetical protein